MSTELQAAQAVPFQQIERMAQAVAKSQLFGCKSPEQALALMLLAQAEGMHPALAARDYHIINNRPALKADTMLARFQQAGGKVDWKEYTDTTCIGVFSHSQAGSVTVEWTIARAETAGLMRNPTWKSYPRAMLRARCISEGVRTCFPGVAIGTYTVEEAQDMEVTVSPPMTQAAAVQAAAAALTEMEVSEHVSAINAAADAAALATAFSAAWTHAGHAKDLTARDLFKATYDARKAALAVTVTA
jgi:hypothetical protein